MTAPWITWREGKRPADVTTASPTAIGPCASSLDRTGHSGAHPEVVVRRVRDRVDVELRDVAVDDLELKHDAPPCARPSVPSPHPR
jgi:hypothetical protein